MLPVRRSCRAIWVLVAIFGLGWGSGDLRSGDGLAAFSRNARILFQGDSITDGNRGRNEDPNHILGHGYQFIIAARYGSLFADRQLTFLNRGVSGDTVRKLAQRWQVDTLDLKPDVLSILIGINDQAAGVSFADYERILDQLLQDARAANPKVKLVLGEPFALPVKGYAEPAKWREVSEGLKKRQEIVARLARKYGAALVRFQQAFDSACRRAPAAHWIWDGIHPTYAGHQLMADAWVQAVDVQWPGGSIRSRR